MLTLCVFASDMLSLLVSCILPKVLCLNQSVVVRFILKCTDTREYVTENAQMFTSMSLWLNDNSGNILLYVNVIDLNNEPNFLLRLIRHSKHVLSHRFMHFCIWFYLAFLLLTILLHAS